MLRKIPVAGERIRFREIFLSLSGLFAKGRPQERFQDLLSELVGKKHSFLLDSGETAAYIILESLKKASARTEVILPAYTASSLLIAIKKAGLKPVFCDISLEDFNMDMDKVSELVNDNTLCILGVHMFGIVSSGIGHLADRFPGVFIIEDCAQSFGSKLGEGLAGAIAETSFFSFNRGKNLPTCGGGCILTNNDELADRISQEVKKVLPVSIIGKIALFFKILAFSLVVRPVVYGVVHNIISGLKDVAPPFEFEIKVYTNFQASIGSCLLRRSEEFCRKRYDNGMKLIDGLKDVDGIKLPEIIKETTPSFNRLPVVFENLEKRDKVVKLLWDAGIETSKMYLKPLHTMLDLGYGEDDFPNATYFAGHLLTLPVHSAVEDEDLYVMIDIIKKSVAGVAV